MLSSCLLLYACAAKPTDQAVSAQTAAMKTYFYVCEGEDKSIVVLDADLSESTRSHLFAKQFPDRFFQMGIQEANMIGTAAGLASSGKTAFCCSFSSFITGRFDQIRVSLAYTDARVTIVGTHAGCGVGPPDIRRSVAP